MNDILIKAGIIILITLIAMPLILNLLYFIISPIEAKRAEKFLKSIDYTCGFDRIKAYAGDNIKFNEEISNPLNKRIKNIRVDLYCSENLKFAVNSSTIVDHSRCVTSIFSLGRYQKVTRRWDVVCEKRGYYRIEKVVLFINGYITYTKAVDVEADIYVYPQIDKIRNFSPSLSLSLGNATTKRSLIKDPFINSGIKEYTYNEPMNLIHWPVSAKYNNIMVRNNDYTARTDFFIILNIQSKLIEHDVVINPEISELGIEIAASFTDWGLSNGMDVKFSVNGSKTRGVRGMQTVKKGSGGRQANNIMEMLSSLVLINTIDFSVGLRKMAKYAKNCEVLIITPYIDSKLNESIIKIKEQADNVSIVATGKKEQITCWPYNIKVYYEGIDKNKKEDKTKNV